MITGTPAFDYPAGAISSDPSDDVVYHFYYNAQRYAKTKEFIDGYGMNKRS